MWREIRRHTLRQYFRETGVQSEKKDCAENAVVPVNTSQIGRYLRSLTNYESNCQGRLGVLNDQSAKRGSRT
jgi:hypothetical protein